MKLSDFKKEIPDSRVQKNLSRLFSVWKKEWTGSKQFTINVTKGEKGWVEISVDPGRILTGRDVRPDLMDKDSKREWDLLGDELKSLAEEYTDALQVELEVYYNDSFLVKLKFPVSSKNM